MWSREVWKSGVFVRLGLCGALLSQGCDGGDTDTLVSTPNTSVLTTQTGLPSLSDALSFEVTNELTTGELVPTAMVYDDDVLRVGTDLGVYWSDDGQLAALELWHEDGEPEQTGRIHRFVQHETRTMAVADNGFFYAQDNLLVYAPASAAFSETAVHAVDAVVAEGVETLWLATSDGLQAVTGEQSTPISVPDTTGASAVAQVGSTLLATLDDQLYELNLDAQTYAIVEHELGEVHSITRGFDGTALLTGTQGITLRDAEGDYTQWTLGDSSTQLTVTNTVYDSVFGYAVTTDRGLLHLGPDLSPQWVIGEGAGLPTGPLAFDPLGDLWMASGAGIQRVEVGRPATFSDVDPLLTRNCHVCHVDNDPSVPLAFDDPAWFGQQSDTGAGTNLDAVIDRVVGGEMPPAPASPLSREEYAILLRWRDGGRQP